MMPWQLIEGDCLAVLKGMACASVDSVVTDPPAGIEFMGKEWDSFATRPDHPESGEQTEHWDVNPGTPFARRATPRPTGKGKSDIPQIRANFIEHITAVMRECLRVLRPGGHAVVWALPRTSHWTATAVEDAGFEIRDNGVHLHVVGSGFPKGRRILELEILPDVERQLREHGVVGEIKWR